MDFRSKNHNYNDQEKQEGGRIKIGCFFTFRFSQIYHALKPNFSQNRVLWNCAVHRNTKFQVEKLHYSNVKLDKILGPGWHDKIFIEF